jgi:hypothetical protein
MDTLYLRIFKYIRRLFRFMCIHRERFSKIMKCKSTIFFFRYAMSRSRFPWMISRLQPLNVQKDRP